MARKPVTIGQVDRSSAARSVNRNKGNKRYGKTFKTVKAKGGEFHVYGSGDRIFVPGKAQRRKKIAETMAEAKKQTGGRVGNRRGGKPAPKARTNTPKPGDAGERRLPGVVGAKPIDPKPGQAPPGTPRRPVTVEDILGRTFGGLNRLPTNRKRRSTDLYRMRRSR